MNLTRKLMNREAFMGLFILSVGGLGGLILGIPIIGFVLSPLIKPPPSVWRDVGAVDKFKIGTTVAVVYDYDQGPVQAWSGSTQKTKAWLRRNDAGRGPSSFTAFAAYCTHLGCPVLWLQDPKIFLCPCHGSVFNGDGTVAGGPAPRALFTYPLRIRHGRVQIQAVKQPVVT
jgi:menaquinol-cytochrome c reductase iron-sulfur subunit